jgi:CHASE3 domain sensor protein
MTVSVALLTPGWLVQYLSYRKDISARQLVLHSEEVLERSGDPRSRLSEAATEIRGFLLTSDTEFLGGLKAVTNNFSRIKRCGV